MKAQGVQPTLAIVRCGERPDDLSSPGRHPLFRLRSLVTLLGAIFLFTTNATLGFPKDYIAGSMLAAMAAVIGNTHSAEAMPGWKEYAILFVALVGCPGVCKSHPLSYLMQPLIDHDAEKAAQFAEALKRYNAAMELPPKERVANGYELNPAEPRRVRFMMQDVTNEAVSRPPPCLPESRGRISPGYTFKILLFR